MNQIVKVEIPVNEATARALTDPLRLEAVGRIVDRYVRSGQEDPLAALLEQTAADAKAAGLTEADIEAELAAYNSERRG